MAAKKGKLRRRFDASSEKQLEALVLFLDRNLGKFQISAYLRARHMRVEVHDDYLPGDAPDEAWIKLVGQKNWVAITEDKGIKYRPNIHFVKTYAARVICITMRGAKAKDRAELLFQYRYRLARFVQKTQPPFVARINKSGHISLIPSSGDEN